MVDLTANSQTDRPESAAPRRDGVQQLLSLIDDMRARPTRRQGDLALPTVVIGGQTDGVSAAIRARQNPPPCAFVTVNEVKGQLRYRIFADVLRQAAEQLASTAPRGEPRIRFPLLYHVLWLIGLPLPTDQNEIEDYVKREIANRARQRSLTGSQGARSARANIRAYVEGPLTAWFAIASILNVAWFLAWDISLTPVFLSVAISIVGAVGHIWALSRSWAGGMRYRWFSRQPYIWPEQDEPGDRPTDAAFFASRVLHVRGMVEKSGPPYGTTAARHEAPQPDSRSIELLIVNAFLEDLRQAYERSLWKIWRRVTWTRTIYPMLLIDGECGPLAESFEQVRAKTATPDPLLLMAAPAEDGGIAADMTTPSSTSRRPEDLDRTWSAWKAALARDRRIGSRRVLAVDIDDKHARLLQADGSIPRSARRKPFLSQLWVPVALVTTLAVGPAAYVVTVEFDTCQWGIKRVETGECIGVGVDGFSFDQRLKPVTDRIDANNKKVLKSGNPHVTVYHLGGFSVPKDSAAGDGDLLADAHGELMGALLLQERLIDNSADRTIPLLQLLPVNAGSAYRYASDAVDAMLEQLDQHSESFRATSWSLDVADRMSGKPGSSV